MFTGYYVEVIGPYDGTFHGPFETREKAQAFNEELHNKLDPNVFDTYVYDHAQYVAKVSEFGPMNVELPENAAAAVPGVE